jgi:endonuclease YncB( thermonuclease family)
MARSFRRWPRGLPWLVGALLIGLLSFISRWESGGPSADADVVDPALVPPVEGACSVVTVLAGDLVLIRQAQGVYRLRLLGIHVPDEVSSTAATRLREICERGEATIYFDKRRMTASGEALAWLYVGESLAAEELVSNGVARFDSYPGDDMALARALREAEDDARRHKRGIWARQTALQSGAGKSRLWNTMPAPR